MFFFSKEIETKLEEATHYNKEIRAERDKLKERLKQAEENLAHQVKVTNYYDENVIKTQKIISMN